MRASIKPCEKVLISGNGGGVVFFAVQFALSHGCELSVTSSSDFKIAKSISLGANSGYIYHDTDLAKKMLTEEEGVDVVLDGASGSGFSHLVRACNPGARIVF